METSETVKYFEGRVRRHIAWLVAFDFTKPTATVVGVRWTKWKA